MSSQEQNPPVESSEFGILRNENIERLSRQVAKHVNRPRGTTAEDAFSDAALILLKMRDRWVADKSAHMSPERQERLAVSWARLRLMDQYESEFARLKKTVDLRFAGGVTATSSENDHDAARDVIDPTTEDRRLSDLDRAEIQELIERLPVRQKQITKMLLYDGMTQAEVASQLGVSQPAICATYERARESLRDLLEPFVPGGK